MFYLVVFRALTLIWQKQNCIFLIDYVTTWILRNCIFLISYVTTWILRNCIFLIDYVTTWILRNSFSPLPQRSCVFATYSDFVIPISLKPDVVDLTYFKLWILSPNLMNLSCISNPPKTGFNWAPASILKHWIQF